MNDDNHSTTNNLRKSIFPKEQINQDNKPEVNNKFQVQADAIRSAADDIEKIEIMILQKKSLLKKW
jgi:hypothetical protein